ASSIRCFNTGGIDWLGRRFEKHVNIKSQGIAALWCGAQIPQTLSPGEYHGSATVTVDRFPSESIPILLHVQAEVAKDAGDANPADMTRLRWLDSTIGLDDRVVAPYVPLKVTRDEVSGLGPRVQFGSDGLPHSIRSGQHEVLAGPIRLVADGDGMPVIWKSTQTRTFPNLPGAVTHVTDAVAGPLTVQCISKMEADGYLNYRVSMTTDRETNFSDIRLEIPIRRDAATYMMGMGRKGGYRPAEWKWDWNSGNANNMVWIGSVEAGLQCKLKDVEEKWDLFKLSHTPDAWSNGGKGGCTVTEQGLDTVLLKAYCGSRTLAAGQNLEFTF